MRRDILVQLGLQEPREFVAGFARPNLRLSVHQVATESEKYDRLQALIAEHKTGIVYCATRKRVEAVQANLAGRGVKTIAYHGGLSDTEREFAQNHFIDRHSDVAVATNAFGMGIDRSDIRFVAHFEVPGSVEAYYQEAGRAGRDGEPAVCELYFNFADTRVQEFFIEGSNPSRAVIQEVYGLSARQRERRGRGHAAHPRHRRAAQHRGQFGQRHGRQRGFEHPEPGRLHRPFRRRRTSAPAARASPTATSSPTNWNWTGPRSGKRSAATARSSRQWSISCMPAPAGSRRF